jgi:predicted O-methyltransferase YrrM
MRILTHFLIWRLGLASAQTQTTAAERDCLALHAAYKRCCVEVGVWHGVTTCRLRAAMAADGMLYAVDPYPAGRLGFSMPERIAHAEVARVCNGQVRWIRATGVAAAAVLAAELAGQVDFIFIDGDHSYEGLRDDWQAWSPLVRPGGIVALHDSRSTAARPLDDAGSVRYTRDVILRDSRFEPVDAVDSLSVVRKRLP